jgi:hypothetical protein
MRRGRLVFVFAPGKVEFVSIPVDLLPLEG